MKKLLGAALCAALVLPSGPAGAELLKNLKVSGGLDLQALSSRNVTDFATNRSNVGGGPNNDRIGGVGTRTSLGLGWDLLDDVHAKVSVVKNDRTWGTVGGVANGGQTPGTGLNQNLIGAPGAASDIGGNVFVQEASIKIDKLFGHVDATAGRQFYGDSGDLIVYYGPKNVYGLFVTAIDALRADWSNDWFNFSGLAGKTAGSGFGATAADVDVRGFDVGIKNLPVKTNVFVWNRLTHAVGALGVAPNAAGVPATGVNDNLFVYGFKLKGEAMGGWAGLTVAANGGTNRAQALVGCGAFGCNAASANYTGKGFLLDAGYKADAADVAAFTPWFNYGWGSGRQNALDSKNDSFMSVASDYRPGVIYGRFNSGAAALGGAVALGGVGFPGSFINQAGLNNRVIWGLGLKATPAKADKLTAGISYWDFSFQKATASGATASPVAVGNRHIGSEFDLVCDWAHSENVTLSAGWATFQPGGHIKETVRALVPANQRGNNPATMVFGDLSVKF